MFDNRKHYTRYNNILYEDGVPVVKFTSSKFIDVGNMTPAGKPMSDKGMEYIRKYMRMFPNNYEIMAFKPQIKRFFYDTETTGLNWRRCSIHQLSAYIEIDGVVVEKINLHIRPHDKAEIADEALRVSGVTREQIQAYEPMDVQFRKLIEVLYKYVDPFNKQDKFFMVGFKNASFDDDFLKKYFDLMKTGFWLYFFPSSIDVSVLAAQYLIKTRYSMPSFKLSRVAKTLGIEVDDSKLHDADYDVHLTREIYQVVSRIEENLF